MGTGRGLGVLRAEQQRELRAAREPVERARRCPHRRKPRNRQVPGCAVSAHAWA